MMINEINIHLKTYNDTSKDRDLDNEDKDTCSSNKRKQKYVIS